LNAIKKLGKNVIKINNNTFILNIPKYSN